MGHEQIWLPVIRGAPCSLVLLVKETKEGQARPTVFTTVDQEWTAEICFMYGGFCGEILSVGLTRIGTAHVTHGSHVDVFHWRDMAMWVERLVGFFIFFQKNKSISLQMHGAYDM